MASEMLKSVLEAERECAAREAEAKKQAELDKQEAKQKAKDMVTTAQKEADRFLRENEAALTKKTEKAVGKARAEAQVACLHLSKNAETNLDSVKKLVVKLLTTP